MKVSLIVAMSQNRVIGRENQMPWHLPDELQYFKRVTMGKPVLMGRNTFESIGKPLPGRPNIVITRNTDYEVDGISVVNSVEDALDLAEQLTEHDANAEAMVIGGAQIFAATFPRADLLYLTIVQAEVEGDVFFPEFPAEEWRLVSREERDANERNPYPYSVLVLERKR
ncbi:MAG: type 3 dihydrofolate reductase [Gammaproteobacteria bacterium]